MGILLLTKSIFAIMIGFLTSVVLGYIMIPILKRMNIGQRVSIFVGENHKKKEGTPTMGGLIFIIATLFTTVILLITKKNWTYNQFKDYFIGFYRICFNWFSRWLS